jgi:hypothetical protein
MLTTIVDYLAHLADQVMVHLAAGYIAYWLSR